MTQDQWNDLVRETIQRVQERTDVIVRCFSLALAILHDLQNMTYPAAMVEA